MTDPYQQPVSLDKGPWAAPPAPWADAPGHEAAWGTPPPALPAPGGHGFPPGPPLGGWPEVPYQRRPQPVPSWALASPGLRLGALLLNAVLMVVTLFLGYLVWALVLWNEGTNPGKKMLGLAVVRADTGRRCTFGDMVVRNLVFGWLVMGFVGVVTLYVGTLVDAFMVFGERRQRGVDKMAGTLVVVVQR